MSNTAKIMDDGNNESDLGLLYHTIANINALTAQVATMDFWEMWAQIEHCLTPNYALNKMALANAPLVNNSGSELYGLIVKGWFSPGDFALAIDDKGNILHAEVDEDMNQMLDISAYEDAFPLIQRFYKGSYEAKTWGMVWDETRYLNFFLDCEDTYQSLKSDFVLVNDRVAIADDSTTLALTAFI